MHAERRGRVTVFLGGVTGAELAEIRTAVPMPAWGQKSYSVRDCLRVLIDEHIEHRRFTERDLGTLAAT
jgi:hypothetical protein